MKILVIPDVHGRDFWMKPCEHIDEFDKVIFLGDYHDPYTFQVSTDTSRHRFRDNLIPFIEAHQDKVVCLFGNHDGNYIGGNMADRFDRFHCDEIRGYLNRMNLKLAHKEGDILFTHSGVLPLWLQANNLTIDDLINADITHMSSELYRALMQVSPYRGGWDKCGSCVWGDVDEYYDSTKIEGLYQIFGHTQQEEDPIITNEFACLDCRKAFVLNTDNHELTEWKDVR